MADKFIRHGATFNGNGTSSALATVDGGVGAWNNINVLEGAAPAYGVLAAGDTVFIRSKDEAGSDITRASSGAVYLGSTAGTITAPVVWIIDGGNVWPGVAGVLKYQISGIGIVTLQAHNWYMATLPNSLVIQDTNAASDNKGYISGVTGVLTENLTLDFSLCTSPYPPYLLAINDSCRQEHRNLYMKFSRMGQNGGVIGGGVDALITLFNPQIEVAVADNRGAFAPGDYGGKMRIFGGRMFGAGATTGSCVVNNSNTRSGTTTLIGFRAPRTVALTKVLNSLARVEAFGLDDYQGAAISEGWGEANSRSDGFYPTLSAFLPDSAGTPWSWKVYPSNASRFIQTLVPVSKVYTEEPATKTITAEVLIADTVAADSSTLWIDVQYTDNTTGVLTSLSTKTVAPGSLTASSAPWSASTYGPVNLLKRKLSVVTPTAIKKNTLVTVMLRGTWAAASANDIMFFDPDLALT